MEVDTNPFRYTFYFSTFTMISLIDSNSICNPRVAMTEANTTIPCKPKVIKMNDSFKTKYVLCEK